MKKILICLLALVFSLSAKAQTVTATATDIVYEVQPLQQIVDLNGNWKFNKGDNPKWAKNKFSTNSWRDMVVPNWDWEEGYLGYGWFRREFSLPAKETYIFNLGQVDDDCEVYFNGEKLELYIGNKPGNDNADTSRWNQWKKYRSYYIPKKLVNAKSNTIAIRVWNTLGAQGGIRYGNIFVGKTVFYNKLPVNLQGDWLSADGSNQWLVGLYHNKVAYKGKVWNYGEIITDNNHISINLVNGNQKEKLIVAASGGKGNYMIGPDEAGLKLCSVTETYKVLPQADKITIPDSIKNTGKAYLNGYIKDHTPSRGGEGMISLIDNVNTRDYQSRFRINSDGSFKAELDVTGTKMVELRIPGFSESVQAYVSPGKTIFMAIDPEEFKIRVTNEYYNRERLTLFMGDMALDSKLLLYTGWLNGMVSNDRKVWDRFIYTANQYADQGNANGQLNAATLYIATNYGKYQDTAALKKAKLWSARLLMADPGNHTYNSTFNVILQNLGEHLEGLQYLVKALDIAEKDKNEVYVKSYKQQIKQFVGEMIKD